MSGADSRRTLAVAFSGGSDDLAPAERASKKHQSPHHNEIKTQERLRPGNTSDPARRVNIELIGCKPLSPRADIDITPTEMKCGQKTEIQRRRKCPPVPVVYSRGRIKRNCRGAVTAGVDGIQAGSALAKDYQHVDRRKNGNGPDDDEQWPVGRPTIRRR